MGFVYEHISVEERLQIGLVAALGRGSYGLVSGLARSLGTSRKFIYTLSSKVTQAAEGALKAGKRGPKALGRTIEVDRIGLDRAILTLAMAGRVSERPISECLAEIIETRPSLGYVSGVINRASKRARAFNETLVLPLADAQVEADELFACGRAHLAALDHASLLILALDQSDDCNGQTWEGVLDKIGTHGVRIARLGSDGGKAIAKAVGALSAVEHQLDRFHALRAVRRVVRSLEQVAYRAIAEEEAMARKAGRMRMSHPVGAFMHERVAELKADTNRLIDRYEAMNVLASWVAESLEAIEVRTGRLRSKEECLAELGAVTELMRELKGEGVRRLADYLDSSGEGLLAYVGHLEPPMTELSRELGEEGVRMLSREWLLEKKLRHSRRTEDRRACLQVHLLAMLHYQRHFDEARKRVYSLLDSCMRGSSIAECINSLLRPYAFLMRGLGKSFLPLFQLYRNAHLFERGKRHGQSPFQLAGIETPDGDWLDWLGLGRHVPSSRPSAPAPLTLSSPPIAA